MGRISMFCGMENNVLSYKSAYYKVITVFGKLIQYSVIQFFLNPYMDKGFENSEERDWLFCNVFFIIILYYIYLYIDI